MKKLFKFLKEEKGVETVEWGVWAAAFALGMVVVGTALATNLGGVYTAISAAITAAIP